MKQLSLFLALVAAACGMLWYAFHTQIILVSFPALAEYTAKPADKKTITLYWYHDGQKNEEKNEIIWAASTQENINTVVAAWLALLQDEGVLEKYSKVETVALAQTHEAFISFSHSIFNENSSLTAKWQIIESLTMTLQRLFPELTHVRFLVHDKPLVDEHIDCSQSVPLTPFLQNYTLKSAPPINKRPPYKIVIHPYGGKNKTGRVIDQEFERKLTRASAEKIKSLIEKRGDYVVFLTHEIGQPDNHEQNATLANRLPADLYIDVTIFHSKKIIPEISLYFPLYNPTTDFWQKKRDALTLTPICNGYLKHITTSLAAALTLSTTLKTLSGQHILVHQALGLPLTQLVGIETPSLVIECGIQKADQVEEIASLIAHACLAGL